MSSSSLVPVLGRWYCDAAVVVGVSHSRLGGSRSDSAPMRLPPPPPPRISPLRHAAIVDERRVPMTLPLPAPASAYRGDPTGARGQKQETGGTSGAPIVVCCGPAAYEQPEAYAFRKPWKSLAFRVGLAVLPSQ